MLTRQSATLRGGLSGANASATNCGPRAEPPIPTESMCVKRPSGDDGGLICSFKVRNLRYKAEDKLHIKISIVKASEKTNIAGKHAIRERVALNKDGQQDQKLK